MVEIAASDGACELVGVQLRSCSWLVLVRQLAEQVALVHPTPLSFMMVVSVLAGTDRPQPGPLALLEVP